MRFILFSLLLLHPLAFGSDSDPRARAGSVMSDVLSLLRSQ
jgi:hypothetical protein